MKDLLFLQVVQLGPADLGDPVQQKIDSKRQDLLLWQQGGGRWSGRCVVERSPIWWLTPNNGLIVLSLCVCVGRVIGVCTVCLKCVCIHALLLCVCLQCLILCICECKSVCANQEFTPGKFELTGLIRPLQVGRYEWDAFSCPLPLGPAEAYRNISDNFTVPAEI